MINRLDTMEGFIESDSGFLSGSFNIFGTIGNLGVVLTAVFGIVFLLIVFTIVFHALVEERSDHSQAYAAVQRHLESPQQVFHIPPNSTTTFTVAGGYIQNIGSVPYGTSARTRSCTSLGNE